MHKTWWVFEHPIRELERQLEDLRIHSRQTAADLSPEIETLERQIEHMLKEIYRKLSPWEKALVARHPNRPYTLDYIGFMLDDFIELHGDRLFADDAALVAGLGHFEGRPIAVIGHQKGRGTRENIRRNFGMMNPEGYRKALRVMRLAARFGHPILCFIDTQGAFPGRGAEARGQAEAIANNLMEMSRLPVPVIVVITGEGGSGGALGIGLGDCMLIQEHSVYSVISPEGCAAILFHDSRRASEVASSLKITAQDLERLGIADGIIAEPIGGAHRNPLQAALKVAEAVRAHLHELDQLSKEALLEHRYNKYRRIGFFSTVPTGDTFT